MKIQLSILLSAAMFANEECGTTVKDVAITVATLVVIVGAVVNAVVTSPVIFK